MAARFVLTRRQWLGCALLGGIAGAAEPSGKDTAQEEAEVQAHARKAGLKRFRTTVTEHYLGIGDCSDTHREHALKISKQLAATYQKHFHDKGFAVTLPSRRLTVVTLKDKTSYEKFVGDAPGEDEGGHFNLETNQLVVFDFRPAPGDPDAIANPDRVNTFTLIHEGIHQLTFNTGLLNLQGDVPDALSEGLAMYGELWRPTGRLAFGQVNMLRRDVILDQDDLAAAWIPIGTLLKNDAVLRGKAYQLAYAESWLLVHFFLRTTADRLRKFRAYLDAIQPRRDPAERINDATAHLGDLDQLDRDLRKYAGLLR